MVRIHPHSRRDTVELDTESLYFYLIVRTAHVVQLAILPPPAKIPRVEHHAAAALDERIPLPPFRSSLWEI
jgi:hypothetical protein